MKLTLNQIEQGEEEESEDEDIRYRRLAIRQKKKNYDLWRMGLSFNPWTQGLDASLELT